VIGYSSCTFRKYTVVVLKEGTERTRGKEAQRNNIIAAKIIVKTVKLTLGLRS
jgi:hypothetical protein